MSKEPNTSTKDCLNATPLHDNAILWAATEQTGLLAGRAQELVLQLGIWPQPVTSPALRLCYIPSLKSWTLKGQQRVIGPASTDSFK